MNPYLWMEESKTDKTEDDEKNNFYESQKDWMIDNIVNHLSIKGREEDSEEENKKNESLLWT